MKANRPAIIVQLALLALLAIACLACATSKGAVTVDRTCFSAAKWGPAPDSIRPCVKLKANNLRRAVRFTVSDADGVVRYTGYVNTPYRRIIHIRVVRLYEDGSFTWKARSWGGRTYMASVGNLQD
jgi:hypothetical protein